MARAPNLPSRTLQRAADEFANPTGSIHAGFGSTLGLACLADRRVSPGFSGSCDPGATSPLRFPGRRQGGELVEGFLDEVGEGGAGGFFRPALEGVPEDGEGSFGGESRR